MQFLSLIHKQNNFLNKDNDDDKHMTTMR